MPLLKPTCPFMSFILQLPRMQESAIDHQTRIWMAVIQISQRRIAHIIKFAVWNVVL